MNTVVKFEGVVKAFGSVQALRGVTFSAPRGCIVGLVGPNGAGKTTTLKILVGVLKRDYGVVEVLGHDPWVEADIVRSATGFLPEIPELPSIKVSHLLAHVARLKGISDIIKEIRRVSRITGIRGILDRKANSLSAGWRQRVALAISLIGEPELLVLDEPASNLDPVARSGLYELMRRLSVETNLSIILSTHILAEVQDLVDYLVIISNGMIVAEGYVSELVKKTRGVVRAWFKARNPQHARIYAREILGFEGVKGVEIDDSNLLVIAKREFYENVKELLLKNNFELIEEKAADLLELYRKLVEGGAS